MGTMLELVIYIQHFIKTIIETSVTDVSYDLSVEDTGNAITLNLLAGAIVIRIYDDTISVETWYRDFDFDASTVDVTQKSIFYMTKKDTEQTIDYNVKKLASIVEYLAVKSKKLEEAGLTIHFHEKNAEESN